MSKKLPKLDPRQLDALLAVLETQSFEKAADVLFVTQSAVSQRIKQLEETLEPAPRFYTIYAREFKISAQENIEFPLLEPARPP